MFLGFGLFKSLSLQLSLRLHQCKHKGCSRKTKIFVTFFQVLYVDLFITGVKFYKFCVSK